MKPTSAILKKLGLPTQAGIADEFFKLADKLGVGREPHKPHPPHPWHKAKPE